MAKICISFKIGNQEYGFEVYSTYPTDDMIKGNVPIDETILKENVYQAISGYMKKNNLTGPIDQNFVFHREYKD